MRLNTIHRGRAAFTLVELMVAAAACLLIMAILAGAFGSGLDTMRQLKAIGDLQDQLRAASNTIRRDLSAAHFNPDDAKPNMGLKLSDQRLDRLFLDPVTSTLRGWTPPTGGFFRAKCAPALLSGTNVKDEGIDNDGLRSYRIGVETVGGRFESHYLHFTSVLPGGRDQDLYTATVGGNTFSSRAAEIALFLDPTPTGNAAAGVPLYNLIGRKRLAAIYPNDPTHQQLQLASTLPDAPAVISMGGAGVNTMESLTLPQNRLGGAMGLAATPQPSGDDRNLSALGGNRVGDDVLLSNVISFEVKLLWTPAFAAAGIPPKPFGTSNTVANGTEDTDAPFNFIPDPRTQVVPPRQPHNSQVLNTFDTWSPQLPNWDREPPRNGTNPNALPQRIRVMGVRIVLRVWDQKVQQTRQVTIVQDM